jgi:hypothetical protein
MPVDFPCLFVIVGKNDNLIYQAEFTANQKVSIHFKLLVQLVQKEAPTHLSQFILHSSLDVVDELVWKNPAM